MTAGVTATSALSSFCAILTRTCWCSVSYSDFSSSLTDGDLSQGARQKLRHSVWLHSLLLAVRLLNRRPVVTSSYFSSPPQSFSFPLSLHCFAHVMSSFLRKPLMVISIAGLSASPLSLRVSAVTELSFCTVNRAIDSACMNSMGMWCRGFKIECVCVCISYITPALSEAVFLMGPNATKGIKVPPTGWTMNEVRLTRTDSVFLRSKLWHYTNPGS